MVITKGDLLLSKYMFMFVNVTEHCVFVTNIYLNCCYVYKQ